MSKVKNAVSEIRDQQQLAEIGDEFESEAGKGFEGTNRDDYAIPFLTILQAMSPECKRSEGNYIEGAQEGMLLNTVTRKVIDPSKVEVQVIPCAYRRAFVEWRVREAGGGFIKEHEVDPALQQTCIRDEKNRDRLPNGNQLNDTRTYYIMMLDDDGVPQPAAIAMTSTQIRKARQWLQQQNMLKLRRRDGVVYTPPMYASKWRVTTVPESNEKGSWFGWAFEHAGYLSGKADPVFQAARDFHLSVASGAVRADLARSDAGPVDPGDVDPETGEILESSQSM